MGQKGCDDKFGKCQSILISYFAVEFRNELMRKIEFRTIVRALLPGLGGVILGTRRHILKIRNQILGQNVSKIIVSIGRPHWYFMNMVIWVSVTTTNRIVTLRTKLSDTMYCYRFFSMYPAVGVALYRWGVMAIKVSK